jgi:hypothetical protein
LLQGDDAMLTDLILFRAAMTRPGDLDKPKADHSR